MTSREAVDDSMILRCRACGIALTHSLEAMEDKSTPCYREGHSCVPKGRIWLSDGSFYPAGNWVANLGDLVNTQHHPELRRLQGCCGLDGYNGVNRVCLNGHEVATETSDCW